MKILVTGVTSIGSKDRAEDKRKIATTVYAVVDRLRAMNHTVIQRPIVPGENLHVFDRVVVVPATLGGFASGYVLGAAYAVATVTEKITLLLDDWQCAKIQPSMAGFIKNQEKNWQKHQLFDRLEEWRAFKPTVMRGMQMLADQWTLPLMAPTFGGEGPVQDLGIQHKGPSLLFDPSIHFANMYGYNKKAVKSREWISSSLTNRSRTFKGLEFSWPLTQYGCKAEEQPRVTEQELFDIYCRAWGVYSPPTGLASGLWWRARYQHAIEAGCILAGLPSETVFCGEAYGYSANQIEGMTNAELQWVAEAQRESYLALRWSSEQLKDSLTDFLSI